MGKTEYVTESDINATPTVRAIAAETEIDIVVSQITVDYVSAKLLWTGFDIYTLQTASGDSGWHLEQGTTVYQSVDDAPYLDPTFWSIESQAFARVGRGDQTWDVKHEIHINHITGL